MITFLAEWALRSSVLIFVGAGLLWILRVKDSSTRLAAWTAMLAGSLLIPLMTGMLPNIPVRIMPALTLAHLTETAVTTTILPVREGAALPVNSAPAPTSVPYNWPRAALALYFVGALAMLMRLGVGLALSFRLMRQSRLTDKATDGIKILESLRIPTPVTLGVLRPVIVLPENWAQWGEAKLNAVLAHERSHIDRHDPAVQLISAIHRSVLWFSPPAWFLHSRIIRIAEEVSDDAGVAMTADRAAYAEILLDFMRSPGLQSELAGIPMSRYGSADRRLHRILDSTTLSRGLTRLSLVLILAIASPLAYVVATARPRIASQVHQSPPPVASKTPAAPRSRGPGRNGGAAFDPDPAFLDGLGTVSPGMVTVRPLVDGLLSSVEFREGQMVRAGDTLAMIEPTSYLDRANRVGVTITAPISGRTGLRQVDPGNIVHARDQKGIVVISQVQPISVLFTLPERLLQLVSIPLDAGQHPVVEAWSADSSTKLATGVLTAIDNQIDTRTGTMNLKATFENTDNKLFPNQFVIARVILR